MRLPLETFPRSILEPPQGAPLFHLTEVLVWVEPDGGFHVRKGLVGIPVPSALSLRWFLMRLAVWLVLWMPPAASALLGVLAGVYFSLRYIPLGLLFSARERSAAL